MTNKGLLINRINLLSEDEVASLLDAIALMGGKDTLTIKPDCPYCRPHTVIRYGHKCRKQRFFCKSCGKTFVPTTHTIMSNSHFPADVWHEVIKDTVHGGAIGYTADRIGCSHQAVFDMRHKVLMALQQLPEVCGSALVVCLGLMKLLSPAAIREKSWTVPSPEPPAGMGKTQCGGTHQYI